MKVNYQHSVNAHQEECNVHVCCEMKRALCEYTIATGSLTCVLKVHLLNVFDILCP